MAHFWESDNKAPVWRLFENGCGPRDSEERHNVVSDCDCDCEWTYRIEQEKGKWCYVECDVCLN